MFSRIFARPDPAARKCVDDLYEQIVAAARQPILYSEWNVPDTPLGRYEMVCLHLFLLLHRVRGRDGTLRNVAQLLTEEFVKDMDHSLRELGIGDMSVPKRMKKLTRMFYGRVASYGEALDRGDRQALTSALARNVRPDHADWPQAADLASYVERTAFALSIQSDEALVRGQVSFEPAAEAR